ncbi:hypothetical protein KUTeg_019596 [Tegillarca granosa]|uniref:G-protein coupled receptors family 2 profile 2 domain-containing protein n=1 Tax=Tegillarca granosa TaxID=220873 RepID=A0ABQ9EDH9_TEGGR|nr:hypothetical protein KUTeg_019596 [Tegillarca granosa]
MYSSSYENVTSASNDTTPNLPGINSNVGDLTYTLLTAVVSCLSIIGGSGIAIIYVCFRELRTPSRKLLVYLSVMDALTAFGNILGVIWLFCSKNCVINHNLGYCKFQSALTIYSSISSFSWTVIIGVCLFYSIVKSQPAFTSTYMKLFHIVSWGLPGFITTMALAVDVLGYDQTLDQASWCWIDPRVQNALFWQFFTGKFWEILSYIFIVVLYTTIIKKGKSKLKKKSKNIVQDANRKLLFVPFVFIVLRVWGTLRFLLGFFAHDYASSAEASWIVPLQERPEKERCNGLYITQIVWYLHYILRNGIFPLTYIYHYLSQIAYHGRQRLSFIHILQGFGDSAQGFTNFIVYCCWTQKIRERLLVVCCMRNVHVEISVSNVSRFYKKSTVDVTKVIPATVDVF